MSRISIWLDDLCLFLSMTRGGYILGLNESPRRGSEGNYTKPYVVKGYHLEKHLLCVKYISG